MTLFGVLLLVPAIICRIELRQAAAQGIDSGLNVVGVRFLGWLGIVVLIMGVALIMADRRRKGGTDETKGH